MRKYNCLICRSALDVLPETHTFTCELCKGKFESEVVCRQGHYVCDTCHSAPEDELIEKVCLHSTSTQPVELAVFLLNMLSVPMQGPVNQYLVPAVLLTAYYNRLGDIQEKKRKLRMARERAAEVIGEFCRAYGVCIAGIGTGIFINLINDTDPIAEGTWGLANQMTSESLRCIEALGDLRCCKRDVLMAVKTAGTFVEQNFQFRMDIPGTITCGFNYYNQDCQKGKCPFRPQEN
ncbi:MAG: DUF5714 domain-containing protein [Bacteroidota bacterium]